MASSGGTSRLEAFSVERSCVMNSDRNNYFRLLYQPKCISCVYWRAAFLKEKERVSLNGLILNTAINTVTTHIKMFTSRAACVLLAIGKSTQG